MKAAHDRMNKFKTNLLLGPYEHVSYASQQDKSLTIQTQERTDINLFKLAVILEISVD